MKAGGTHQLLVNTKDINLLVKNIYAVKKNTKVLFYVRKRVGLDVNAE